MTSLGFFQHNRPTRGDAGMQAGSDGLTPEAHFYKALYMHPESNGPLPSI
jgi:hypothetical protein